MISDHQKDIVLTDHPGLKYTAMEPGWDRMDTPCAQIWAEEIILLQIRMNSVFAKLQRTTILKLMKNKATQLVGYIAWQRKLSNHCLILRRNDAVS